MELKGKKQFKAENRFNEDYYIILEIDFDHPKLIDNMRLICKFFGEEVSTDLVVLDSFIKLVACQAIAFGCDMIKNTHGVRRLFEDAEGLVTQELYTWSLLIIGMK